MEKTWGFDLLGKLEYGEARESLFEFLVDLDKEHINCGPLDSDIDLLLDEYYDSELSEEQNTEFKNELKNSLKDTDTAIHFDMVFYDVDSYFNQRDIKVSKNWVINFGQKFDSSNIHPVSIDIPLDEEIKLGFLYSRALERFKIYLKDNFSIPFAEDNSRKELHLYPWHESWIPEDFDEYRECMNLVALDPCFFMEVIFRKKFDKVQERRKQQYLSAHPGIQIQRTMILNSLVSETLAKDSKVKTTNPYEMKKLLRNVDTMLYALFPEYKRVCLA